MERNENTHSSLYEEWNADLDYVLALSLQNENNPRNNTAAEIPSDVWENCYAKESVPSACLNETDKSNILSCDSLVAYSTSNHIKSKYKCCCGRFFSLKFEGREKEKEDSGTGKVKDYLGILKCQNESL